MSPQRSGQFHTDLTATVLEVHEYLFELSHLGNPLQNFGVCLWEKLLSLSSTYFGFKTLRQVSLRLQLSDLEINWTASFLVQSDKLAIVLHLLQAPEGTVVKPAEHEVVRHQCPIPDASRCFPLSHRLKLQSTGGRTRV